MLHSHAPPWEGRASSRLNAQARTPSVVLHGRNVFNVYSFAGHSTSGATKRLRATAQHVNCHQPVLQNLQHCSSWQRSLSWSLLPWKELSRGRGGKHVVFAAPQPMISSVVKTPTSEIRWGSYLSKKSVLNEAIDECVRKISKQHGPDAAPTLAIVFVSAAFGEEFDRVVPLLRERVPSLKHIFGCSAYGVIGGSRGGTAEVDGAYGFSLTLAQLPGVNVHLRHTLRSSVPDVDAPPERWADFVGVPQDYAAEGRHASFLVFADSRFTQVSDILAGLDYVYPRATKLGGLMSVGVRSMRRAMWAWSAEGDVRNGLRLGQQVSLPQKQQQQQQQPAASGSRGNADPQDESTAAGSGNKRSLGASIGAWFKRLTDSVRAAGEDGGEERSVLGGSGRDSDDDDEDDVEDDTRALHLYGAVILSLHGDVRMDTIISQGYRAPSSTVWKIEDVAPAGADANCIRLINALETPGGDMGSTASGQPQIRMVIRSTGMDDDEDGDSDDDDNGEGAQELEMVGQPALVAVLDVVESLGNQTDAWEDLLDNAVLAVARDVSKPLDELGPSDWEIMELKHIDQDYGTLIVAGELRRGYRMKLMVRDAQGMCDDLRQQLLQYKKDDLAATLKGTPQPPAFGALVFSDIERGGTSMTRDVAILTGAISPPSAALDSTIISGYLPVPTSGILGGAQVAPLPEGSGLLECSCVVGVLRATNAAQQPFVAEGSEGAEEQQQQQQGEKEKDEDSGSSCDSDADGGAAAARKPRRPRRGGGGSSGSGGGGVIRFQR